MKIVGYAVLGLSAAFLGELSQSFAISTASVVSEIKFSVSSSVGTLNISAPAGSVSSGLDILGVGTDSDTANGSVSSVMSSVGANSASASTKLFEGRSEISLGVPTGESGSASASSDGFAKMTLSNFGPATSFTLAINPFYTSLEQTLFTDNLGVLASGGGSYSMILSYKAYKVSRNKTETESVSIEIGSDDWYDDAHSESRSLSFMNIPTSAFELTLSWKTMAEAAVETRIAVPEGGASGLMMAVGVFGMACFGMRRK